MFKAQDFLVRNVFSAKSYVHKFPNHMVDIQRFNEDRVFMEQLLVANPKLYRLLKKYSETGLSKKKERNLFNSIYKYYKRSFSRATPFGLFSETSIGSFSSQENYILNSKTEKNILLDMDWLIKLIHKLENEFSEDLSFKINNANYVFGDRVHQIYSINSSDLEEINIRLTDAYQVVEHLCSDSAIHYKKIVSTLISKYGVKFEKLIRQYVVDLIDNHYLISDLQEDVVDDFSLNILIHKISKIKKATNYVTSLRIIEKLIAEYQVLKIGEGIEKLTEIYSEMEKLCPSNNYLRVDLFNKSKICLSLDIKEKVEKLADFFNNIMSSKNNTHLNEYMDRFIEKYGIHQEVQLVEMLDESFGIGAPRGYEHPQNVFYEESMNIPYIAKEEELYIQKYEEALVTNSYINIEELYDYYSKNYNSTRLNKGIELFFHILKRDGKVTLLLSNTVGTNNLGAPSGRFSQVSTELDRYHKRVVSNIEQMNHSNKITSCEIVFLPENIRHANVMGNKVNRDKVLPLFTSTKKASVSLDNIYIGISASGKFYAKDISTGDFINLYITNMYNKMLFSNAIRFLYEISIGGYFENLPWDICFGKNHYIPRIVFGDIVLSPERWRLSGSDVGQSDEDLREFLSKNRVPHTFYIVNGDNKMYISMESDLDFRILKDSFNKKQVVELQECIENDAVIMKEKEARVSEIVIPFVEDSELPRSILAKSTFRRTTIDRREKNPFDDWIYLKLYIPTNRQEEFLTRYLKEIQNRVKKFNGEFFFLRYIEFKPQIRLRIKSTELYQTYCSIVDILNISKKNRVVSSFDLSTYDREIERYGGEKLMENVEQLFCSDSYLSIELLYKIKCGDIDLNVDDVAIIMVYSYLKWFFSNNNCILNFLNDVTPKKMKNNFNRLSKHYQMIIQDNFIEKNACIKTPNFYRVRRDVKKLVAKAEDMISYSMVDSIIHVHNNRLIGIDREKEKLIYFIVKKLITTEEIRKGLKRNG